MDESKVKALIVAACELQGKIDSARKTCFDQYRAKETEQANSIRVLVDGAVASMTMKMTQKIQETSETISYQISLAASYVRTHFIINDLIMSGDLIEAITLIRKQLESLTRLHELDKKPVGKLAGKVPNVRHIFNQASGRLYGELSEIAHFAKPRVGELLHVIEEAERVGPNIMPVYSERCIGCYDLQVFLAIYFLGWFTEKLPTWYPGYDNEEDKSTVGYIAMLAQNSGMIELADDKQLAQKPSSE